jgi:CheY-like chemotaxis protein
MKLPSCLRVARADKALAHTNKTRVESRAYQAAVRAFARTKIVKPDRHIDSDFIEVTCGRIQLGKIMADGHKVIAVVDDDPEMRAAMASLLSAYGYGAETFDSAETFLTCASTSKATCLVVDIELGDISGVELAHQLAADGFTYPIIFMTGLDDEVIRNQAAAAGGVAFLHKPFPAQTLFDAIKKASG